MDTFSLSMLYAGFKRVESWWNFKEVVSPFYRLYYIAAGKGRIYMDRNVYELSAGRLFLIPKFAFHSYECDDFMDHYYICFFDDQGGAPGVPEPLRMRVQPPAGPLDLPLVRRYLELNPGCSLPVVDPQQYDNRKALYENKPGNELPGRLESQGILLQLFSRFVTAASLGQPENSRASAGLHRAVRHIHQNLDKRISISELSELVWLTPDHFSRVFKKIMGMPPCEYIQMKRVERAQALLLSSCSSVSQVAESVGICNPAQFSRLFMKVARCTPREYREKQMAGLLGRRGREPLAGR